jgi:hypothetical protein
MKTWLGLGALVLAIGVGVLAFAGKAAEPLPETDKDTIGYPTVADALAAVRAKPGVEISTFNKWTVIADRPSYTVWSFAPPDYPAYPAVVKRSAVPNGAGSNIHMGVLCEASKEACDELVRTFVRMNPIFGNGH